MVPAVQLGAADHPVEKSHPQLDVRVLKESVQRVENEVQGQDVLRDPENDEG